MKRSYAAFLCFFAAALYASPAAACRIMEQPSVESLQVAPVVLIGTVIEAGEDGRVGMAADGRLTFVVQKAIRGVPEGAKTFSVDIRGATSCDSEFRPGERWLYMGYHIRNNSLKLETQEGVSIPAHIEFVKSQTGFDEAAQSLAHRGTYTPICQDGKEAGFEVKLDNGMKTVVFAPMSEVISGRAVSIGEPRNDDPLAQFVANAGNPRSDYTVPLDRQKGTRSGQLDICKQTKRCTPVIGAYLQIGELTEERVTGKIMHYENPPVTSVYTFRVKRETAAACH